MQAQSPTPSTPTQAQKPAQTSGLTIKTHVKAGGMQFNHNETLAHPAGLQVKTHVKEGGLTSNHSQTLVRAPRPATGLKVKTQVKAGGVLVNHNETLARSAGSR